MPSPPQDFIQDCRAQIQHRLDAIRSRRLRLRMPLKPEPMRMARDMHLHSVPELFFQVGGVSRMRFLHETMLLKAGEMLLIPRGIAHMETVYPSKTEFLNMVVGFHIDTIRYHFAKKGGGIIPTITHMERFTVGQVSKIADYFTSAAESQPGADPLSRSILRGNLEAGLASLLKVLEKDAEVSQPVEPRVARARLLIASHLAEPNLSIQRLAQELNCSPDHLSKLFHQETGTTFTQYLNGLRLASAKELLGHSTLPIRDIAWSTGYGDPAYFIRLFRTTFGLTPGAYRRSADFKIGKSVMDGFKR